MRRIPVTLFRALFAAGIVAVMAPLAGAQITTLDKGHQLLVNSGLQIWGCDTGASSFTYGNLTNANFNAVMWSHGQAKANLLSTGQKWGKWVDYLGSPATALNSTENAHYSDLVAIQVGDEQQTDLESPNSATKAWFDAARNGNYFNDKLLYVNSTFVNNVNSYINFVATANPDAISWDAYPFGTTGVSPYNWLGKAQIFRRVALGSYIEAHNAPARPYGLYLQTYSGSDGARFTGDLEMRWQQFTAWTMGYTFVDAFTTGGASSLFTGGSMASPSEPRYSQFKESARQSKNLGPALVRLISYGYGPDIVLGKDPNGNTNQVPIDWLQFDKTHAPPNQQYLTAVSAVNLGTKNNGHPGDVYIGYFNPLHASYGDPAGTAYFMVTNALGAYLQDPTLTPADCTQQITLDFDFGASTINSLQRLRRSDGQVEVVPLTHLVDNKYRLMFNLEGGTGDLFKYNDGSPFVGVQLAASNLYWDSDGLAINNNLTTGAGLGASGNWDSGSSRWYNGTANAAWAAGSSAIFNGTAGTVTLASPQSASSLTFKTNGYAVTGSTLTLSGPTVTVDPGLTATISSTVAGASGLVKNGTGTLNLTTNNTYTGGTTINGGVLGIVSGSLGANPGAPITNVAINNGATLRFNQNNLTLTPQRQVSLGAGGGVIDTAFNNGIDGAVSGSTLTKTGTGTLTLSATNAHSATAVSGGAIVVASDANLGAVPANFTAGNITLNGGTLRFGADFDLSNNRGITLGAGGGTIDTQGFTNPTGYTQHNGIQGNGNLTKVGGGTFFMNTAANQLNADWKGNLIIKEGTWKINERGGLPYNAANDGVYRPGQITLDGGTWQIAANISVTSGLRGITIAAGGGTIDTQNFNLVWQGPMIGDATGTVNKIGSGLLRLNSTAVAPATFGGNLNVNAGALQLDGGTAMGNQASINLANAGGVALTISSASTVIGSLSGGGSSGGNLALSSTLTTGGNNSSTTFNGLITGAGGLVKSGTGTFTLAPATAGNTYGGGTTVNGGTLSVNNTTGSGVGGGNVTVNSGGTLGGNGLVGTAGDASNVTVNLGGHLAPGNSPGTLTVFGNVIFAGGAALDIELGGLAAGSEFDKLTINGAATLNGTLNASLINSFAPVAGSTFEILTASGGLGGTTFANTVLPNSLPDITWHVKYNANSVVLVAVIAGDFNLDNVVDAADYVYWRKNIGTQSAYDAWRSHFGQTAPASGAANTSGVPEPDSLILLTLSGAMLLYSGTATRSGFVQRHMQL